MNLHRRSALNHYEKARALYEALDDNRGTYGRKIHELNRNVAELHKDLPIGKSNSKSPSGPPELRTCRGGVPPSSLRSLERKEG